MTEMESYIEKEEKIEKGAYLGGLVYTKIIKEARSPVFGVYKAIKKSGQFGLFASIFLRSFATGWSIPFVPLLKLLPVWEKHLYKIIKSWGEDICKLAKINLHLFEEQKVSKDKTYLFISNHLSPMDIPVIYSVIPKVAAFVSNIEVASLPVFNFWMRQTGSVFVERDKPDSQVKALKQIVNKLSKGIDLILFPESTMSKDGKLQEFKRGGLSAATFTNTTILPIYLKGTREVMTPGEVYIRQNSHVLVAFGKEFDTKGLSRKEKKEIHKIMHDIYLKLEKKYEPVYKELAYSS